MCPNCTLKKMTASEGRKSIETHKTEKIITQKEKLKNSLCSKEKNGIKTSGYWMREADKWFSRYVRLRFCVVDTDGEPYCKDIITGKLYHAKNIDNGHYHSRYFMGTRYWLDNCRPQNRSSNRFQGEKDKDRFKENLIKEIGKERFEDLEERKNSITHMGIDDYQKVIEGCKKEIDRICKNFFVKKWW